MSTELEKTLIHEMTHAIAGDLGGATVPRDVHEGLAQYLEGERVGNRLPASLVASLAGGGRRTPQASTRLPSRSSST